MNVRLISTTEAANLLGVNEMTVRRWVASGRLNGEKTSRGWQIEASSVERQMPRAGPSQPPLDLGRAIPKTISGRRQQEWLPDALAYADVVRSPRRLVEAVEGRWVRRELEGREIEHLVVPKTYTSSRPGAFLRLDDEVLYTALVLAIAGSIEESLSDSVVSYRLAPIEADTLLRHQSAEWQRFQDAQRAASDGPWSHVLVADIAGFFEYVDVGVLADTLVGLGVDIRYVSGLLGLLKGWQRKSGLRGLPQGPDSSAVLSNAYLQPIDEQLLAEADVFGWKYIRWSDDFRVYVHGEDEAAHASFVLAAALRRRNLSLSSAKTKSVPIKRHVEALDDSKLGIVAYAFDAKEFKAVREDIWPIFQEATADLSAVQEDRDTELRFCLYRMGVIGDDRALRFVLGNLPRLGFVAKFVYLYLRNFASRPEVVSGLTATLQSLHPQRDALLAGQLLRVLEDSDEVPNATRQSVRDWAWSKSSPDAVRAIAITTLGPHGTSADEAEVRSRIWRESDHRVIRSCLATVNRLGPAKAKSLLGDFKRERPEYGEVVEFLNERHRRK